MLVKRKMTQLEVFEPMNTLLLFEEAINILILGGQRADAWFLTL